MGDVSGEQNQRVVPNMTNKDEYDIIICGGGSTGCVPAGRLANLDHNLKVLLIEAGEDNLNNPW